MSATPSHVQTRSSTISSTLHTPLVWKRGFSLQNHPKKRQRGVKALEEEACNDADADASLITVRRKGRKRASGDFAFVSNWPPKPRKKKCSIKRPDKKAPRENDFTSVGAIHTASTDTARHVEAGNDDLESTRLWPVDPDSVPPHETGPDPTSAISYERIEAVIREDYGSQIWSANGQSESPVSEEVVFSVVSRDSSDTHLSYRELSSAYWISPPGLVRSNAYFSRSPQGYEAERANFSLGPQILFENTAHRFTVLLDMCEYFVYFLHQTISFRTTTYACPRAVQMTKSFAHTL